MKAIVERWMTVVIGIAVILVATLAGALLVDLTTSARAGHPAQSLVTASPDVMQMGLAHIPTNNDCVLCHESGGSAGMKIVPAILHPVEGWRRCLVCHTDESLGRTAPGHEGIAESECLNCHKESQGGPAITQPHALLHDQQCKDCHGSVAHLPSSMASDNANACVLCHKPTPEPPPTYHHAANLRVGCSECHRSPEVGNLPIDHARRDDSTCLLCHDIGTSAAAGASAPAGPSGSPPGSAEPGASWAPVAPLPSPTLPLPTLPLPTLPVPTIPAQSAAPPNS